MTPINAQTVDAQTTSQLFQQIHQSIITCERCPRLRDYCRGIGETKRRAYQDQTYWARPVPGFGDPRARILILGLAPGAHGANRTGRLNRMMFTRIFLQARELAGLAMPV